jgi:hypothetical protein
MLKKQIIFLFLITFLQFSTEISFEIQPISWEIFSDPQFVNFTFDRKDANSQTVNLTLTVLRPVKNLFVRKS